MTDEDDKVFAHNLNIRLSKGDLAILREYSAMTGLPMSSAVKVAIREALASARIRMGVKL